ncbi:MAG: DUF1643 domain-containing protein [Pseudomonadota bacterium]
MNATNLFGHPDAGAGATFPIEGYRTHLYRSWGPGKRLCVIGQNPSRATAIISDGTITRCVSRARSMGFDGLDMVNLYPLVTPYPDELFAHPDPLGLAHGISADAAIMARAGIAGMVIAAWGGDRRQAARVEHVKALLSERGIAVHALGFTKDGSPRHPSRLAYSVQPEIWRWS